MEEGGVLECAGLFDADVEVVVDVCDLRGGSVISTLASNLIPFWCLQKSTSAFPFSYPSALCHHQTSKS